MWVWCRSYLSLVRRDCGIVRWAEERFMYGFMIILMQSLKFFFPNIIELKRRFFHFSCCIETPLKIHFADKLFVLMQTRSFCEILYVISYLSWHLAMVHHMENPAFNGLFDLGIHILSLDNSLCFFFLLKFNLFIQGIIFFTPLSWKLRSFSLNHDLMLGINSYCLKNRILAVSSLGVELIICLNHTKFHLLCHQDRVMWFAIIFSCFSLLGGGIESIV